MKSLIGKPIVLGALLFFFPSLKSMEMQITALPSTELKETANPTAKIKETNTQVSQEKKYIKVSDIYKLREKPRNFMDYSVVTARIDKKLRKLEESTEQFIKEVRSKKDLDEFHCQELILKAMETLAKDKLVCVIPILQTIVDDYIIDYSYVPFANFKNFFFYLTNKYASGIDWENYLLKKMNAIALLKGETSEFAGSLVDNAVKHGLNNWLTKNIDQHTDQIRTVHPGKQSHIEVALGNENNKTVNVLLATIKKNNISQEISVLLANNRKEIETKFATLTSEFIPSKFLSAMELNPELIRQLELALENAKSDFIREWLDLKITNFMKDPSAATYRTLKILFQDTIQRFIPGFDKNYLMTKIHAMNVKKTCESIEVPLRDIPSLFIPSIIHTAVDLEDAEWLQQNISLYQSEIDSGKDLMETPLKRALKNKSYALAELLLKAGADVRHSASRITLLDYFVLQNDAQATQLLINFGAEPSKEHLTRAVYCNNVDLVQTLLGFSKKFDEASVKLNLAYAQEKGFEKLISLLDAYLERTRNHQYLSDFKEVINSRNISQLKQMLDLNRYKSVINSADRNGQTPLTIAVLNQSEESVKILLAHGAKPGQEVAQNLKNQAHEKGFYSIEMVLEEYLNKMKRGEKSKPKN